MAKDQYTALWLSHSSINDYLTCPRAYFLKNIYKDQKTKHKIQLVSPALSLGQAVHEVLESLSSLKTDERFLTPLVIRFNQAWERFSGKSGGFTDIEDETRYKKRGEEMLKRVSLHPGPLSRLAVKIQMDLPRYWISDEDNIILCGKLDWLEYLPEKESVRIIDFKTSRNKEELNTLQLPIYNLLASNCQKREIEGASYWYLDQDDEPTPVELPELESSKVEILKIGRKIKLEKQLNSFKCPNGDQRCQACKPFEEILKGNAEYVGTDGRKDNYILPKEIYKYEEPESVVL